MTDDILREATRALRAATDERPRRSELTRARVLQSLHAQKRRNAARAVLLVPLAAVFIGASAAAATGKLPAIIRTVSEVVGISPAPSDVASSPKEPATQRRRPTSYVAPPPSASSAPPVELEQDPKVPADGEQALEAVTSTGEQQKDRPAVMQKMTPAQAHAHSLYRRAHELHFTRQSPSTALIAWNQYLAAYPNHRLSLEARYNRALCLVRLGRYAEASPALERFASGQYGSYRKRDAQALLDAFQDENEPSSPDPDDSE